MRTAPLLEQLRLLRRRERLVHLMRGGCIAALALAAVLPVVALFSRSWIAVGGVTVMAAACATAAAWLQTRSIRAVAAAADAALALDDRLVTALQHHDDQDVFSRLVVADAERRLAGVGTARVFPFRAPRYLFQVAIAAAVVAAAGITASVRPMREPATVGDAPAQEAGGGEGAPADASNAQTRTSPDGTKSPGRPSAADVRVPVHDGSRGETPSDAPTGRTPAGAQDSAPSESAAGSPLSAAAGSDRGRLDAAGPAGGEARTLNARGGGPGRSGSPQLAGGVAADADVDASAPGSHSGPQALRPRRGAAADRAEAAMARDDVPPALRGYVRAYFESIRR